jgi:hypothetical protein
MKKPPFPARRPIAGLVRALLEAVFTLRFASYRLRGTTQAPATSERQALRCELAPPSPPLLGSVLLQDFGAPEPGRRRIEQALRPLVAAQQLSYTAQKLGISHACRFDVRGPPLWGRFVQRGEKDRLIISSLLGHGATSFAFRFHLQCGIGGQINPRIEANSEIFSSRRGLGHPSSARRGATPARRPSSDRRLWKRCRGHPLPGESSSRRSSESWRGQRAPRRRANRLARWQTGCGLLL